MELAGRSVFQVWWGVVTNPSLDTFHREAGEASLGKGLLWVTATRFLTALIWLMCIGPLALLMLMPLFAGGSGFSGESRGVIVGYFAGIGAGALVLSALAGPVWLLLSSGVYYALAMAFGGRGDFGVQTYLLATFMAPLDFGRLLGQIPCVGLFLYLGLWVYKLALAKQALEVTHELESGQALAVVAIPAVVMAGLVVALYAAGIVVGMMAENGVSF